jgi:hypothetical protein
MAGDGDGGGEGWQNWRPAAPSLLSPEPPRRTTRGSGICEGVVGEDWERAGEAAGRRLRGESKEVTLHT